MGGGTGLPSPLPNVEAELATEEIHGTLSVLSPGWSSSKSWSRSRVVSAGDPTLADRIWVLITESPEGGWAIDGHANTGADIVAAARAALRS